MNSGLKGRAPDGLPAARRAHVPPLGAAAGAGFSFAYSSGCSARWIFSEVIGRS